MLVNVVVAVLMKNLEDSNKEALLDELEEKKEREEMLEREEASRRLSAASVGGDLAPNAGAPAQVNARRLASLPCLRKVTMTMTAVMILCGRLRMRIVPMATC